MSDRKEHTLGHDHCIYLCHELHDDVEVDGGFCSLNCTVDIPDNSRVSALLQYLYLPEEGTCKLQLVVIKH